MAALRPSSNRIASSLLGGQSHSAFASTSTISPHLRPQSTHSQHRFNSTSSTPSSTSMLSAAYRPADSLVSHLDPSTLPPVLRPSLGRNKSLYDHLSHLPNDGVGTKVRQVKWAARGLDVPYGEELGGPIAPSERKDRGHLCYWEITRVKLRLIENGKIHGKAWGRFVWRGEPNIRLCVCVILTCLFLFFRCTCHTRGQG